MTKIMMLYIALIFALSGCTYSIKDIDVSKSEPSCTRQCTSAYSQCVSNNVLSSTMMYKACREAYEICISTCPSK